MKDVVARMSERTRAQVDALYRTIEVDIEVDPNIAEGMIEIKDSSGFMVAIYRLDEFKKDKRKGKIKEWYWDGFAMDRLIRRVRSILRDSLEK